MAKRVTCKWNKTKRKCDRSDGRFCDIAPTRVGGRKAYYVTIYEGNFTSNNKLKVWTNKLAKNLADARLFCGRG